MAARKMPTMKQAGAQLKVRREALHLHQKTVAAELGVSPQAVSAWERGANNPELETLAALDRLYGGDGAVLEMYGFSLPQASLDGIAAVLEQVRDVARMSYTVLAQLAEREGIEPPVPSTRWTDPPRACVGRRASDPT